MRSFCHRYKVWQGKQATSMRQTHKAGEKRFVDYCGPTIAIVNPDTGECVNAQIFVAVLGASNYTFACAPKHKTWLTGLMRMYKPLIFMVVCLS